MCGTLLKNEDLLGMTDDERFDTIYRELEKEMTSDRGLRPNTDELTVDLANGWALELGCGPTLRAYKPGQEVPLTELSTDHEKDNPWCYVGKEEGLEYVVHDLDGAVRRIQEFMT